MSGPGFFSENNES